MKNIFLYLYPIEEYSRIFFLGNEFYDSKGVKRPFDVLNECIEKRYRSKGYEIVYALFPDKDIFGINYKDGDRIVYTDITFKEASGYDEDGNEKPKEEIKYPNEEMIISQLGDNIEKLAIGGYHSEDCVKRVGEIAIRNGIDTIIDLDMTELFFSLYRKEDYFNISEYNQSRYKDYVLKKTEEIDGKDFVRYAEEMLHERFSSPAYGFDNRKKLEEFER